MKILIAEDDPLIGAAMEQGLHQAGFTVDWVRDGKTAEAALPESAYALLVLDLGLPGQDGLEVLRQLRRADNHVPVLIVTARDAVNDRVAGLNLGADDYLVKPFDLNELIARARALVRRHAGRARPELSLGTLRLNPISKEVWLEETPLKLSQREFTLLETLMETPGAVFSKEQLEERLYGWEGDVSSNALEVHLHNLRKKLGPDWIRNVRGVGFKVVAPNRVTG